MTERRDKLRESVANLGETGKTLAILAALSALLLVLIGLGLVVQGKLLKEPVLTMKGIAPTMSSSIFADMIGMEIPGFAADDRDAYTFSKPNVLAFLTEMLTDVNPRDPRSLLASEMPGLYDDAVPLRRGLDAHATSPVDYAPPLEAFKPVASTDQGHGKPVQEETDGNGSSDTGAGSGTGEKDGAGDGSASHPTTDGRRVVFVYHSHNRESWVPALKEKGVTKLNEAYDPKINITMVGKRFADKLTELGIGTEHSDTDYMSSVKDYNWNFSYKYSEKTVETAVAGDRDLAYFFDIHRDSQRRDLTTVDIGGKSYAQVYFIIGHRNPNWKKNEAFATQIHDVLQAKYPGLSRGIWGKSANNGNNGEYNQSLSPNSVLIEIGGPENTIEECYRTAEVLAQVFADIYWQAEKVNGNG